jgi:hypothetical protein
MLCQLPASARSGGPLHRITFRRGRCSRLALICGWSVLDRGFRRSPACRWCHRLRSTGACGPQALNAGGHYAGHASPRPRLRLPVDAYPCAGPTRKRYRCGGELTPGAGETPGPPRCAGPLRRPAWPRWPARGQGRVPAQPARSSNGAGRAHAPDARSPTAVRVSRGRARGGSGHERGPDRQTSRGAGRTAGRRLTQLRGAFPPEAFPIGIGRSARHRVCGPR